MSWAFLIGALSLWPCTSPSPGRKCVWEGRGVRGRGQQDGLWMRCQTDLGLGWAWPGVTLVPDP